MATGMTALEAIAYCAQTRRFAIEDDERKTYAAYDRNGDPHWLAWSIRDGGGVLVQSESPEPFARELEPYRTWAEERKRRKRAVK